LDIGFEHEDVVIHVWNEGKNRWWEAVWRLRLVGIVKPDILPC
jgi:hypothetical protein